MLIQDKKEVLGHTLVQHGGLNDRIYIMDYKYALDPYLINQIQTLAKDFNYGKIIAKIPKQAKPKFSRYDFKIEAMIPNFFNGKFPCLFMALYNNEDRKKVSNREEIENVLQIIKNQQGNEVTQLTSDYKIRVLSEADILEMIVIYKEVFKTYPVPIQNPKYLKETMEDETIYFGVFHQNKLIGISSCEINSLKENVEMTDFAVLPKYRGKQLAKHLLREMEAAMIDMGIKTAYSIARSVSIPMNATFSAAGYLYCGTLWNNTQIAGKIESMNVWHKSLS